MNCQSHLDQIAPERQVICAVIVSYNPDQEFLERVESIAQQVNQVVISDNGSKPPILKRYPEIINKDRITILNNQVNLGVPGALNKGIRYAIKLNYHWVLLFDQDTLPLENMVRTLRFVYDSFEPKDLLAVIGSKFFDPRNMRPIIDLPQNEEIHWIEQKTVINSGSLIPCWLFDKIGFYRDEFFMDHADHEMCLRARKHGFKILITRKPIIYHNLGAVRKFRFMGREFWPAFYSPCRWYYIVRNFIFMLKEYLPSEKRWFFMIIKIKIKWMIKILLFEDQKLMKFNNILLGIKDGLISNRDRVINPRPKAGCNANIKVSQ